jgi:lipopolysaccharide transport system permease protein
MITYEPDIDDYHVNIRSDGARPPIDLAEIYQSRELLLTLGIRDIKVRYKQTVLGVVWVVLQPLMASLIFAFIFGVLARLPSDGRPYILFAFAGLMAWNTFSQTLTKASSSLVGYHRPLRRSSTSPSRSR